MDISRMDTSTIIISAIFILIALIFLVNFGKIIVNMFTQPKKASVPVDPLVEEIRKEVNEKVKPNLHALEVMHKNSEQSDSKFGSFVFGLFKDKFSTYVDKNEKLVEAEICKCCSDYEGAECKEEFCLEGSGIACNKS